MLLLLLVVLLELILFTVIFFIINDVFDSNAERPVLNPALFLFGDKSEPVFPDEEITLETSAQHPTYIPYQRLLIKIVLFNFKSKNSSLQTINWALTVHKRSSLQRLMLSGNIITTKVRLGARRVRAKMLLS